MVIRGVFLSKQENKKGPHSFFPQISFCTLNTPNTVLNMYPLFRIRVRIRFRIKVRISVGLGLGIRVRDYDYGD